MPAPAVDAFFDPSHPPFHFCFSISWLSFSDTSPVLTFPSTINIEEDLFSNIVLGSSLSDAGFAAFRFFPLMIGRFRSVPLLFSFFFIHSVVGGFVPFWSQVSLLLLFFSPDLFGIERYDLCMGFSFLCFGSRSFFFLRFCGRRGGILRCCASVDKKLAESYSDVDVCCCLCLYKMQFFFFWVYV